MSIIRGYIIMQGTDSPQVNVHPHRSVGEWLTSQFYAFPTASYKDAGCPQGSRGTSEIVFLVAENPRDFLQIVAGVNDVFAAARRLVTENSPMPLRFDDMRRPQRVASFGIVS